MAENTATTSANPTALLASKAGAEAETPAAAAGGGNAAAAAATPDGDEAGFTRLRALFDYDAREDDELSLRVFQEYIGIRLLEPEGHWWYGKTLDGTKSGIFPANYAEVVKTNNTPRTNNPLVFNPADDAGGKAGNGGASAGRSNALAQQNGASQAAGSGQDNTTNPVVEKKCCVVL